jgi:hypothetical protein
MTKFTLTKGNLSCSTNLLSIVRLLRKLGWKVKHSELGELI